MQTAIALKNASESYKLFSAAMLDYVKTQYGQAQTEETQASESDSPKHSSY